MASWNTRRQLLYFSLVAGFFLIIIATLLVVYRPIATCRDGRQNQEEDGIDCGGPCSKACPNRIVPLKVLWQQDFQISTGVYDVAALIENANPIFGIPIMGYKVKLLDEDNVLIAERRGETVVNPGGRFVIYEPGLSSGARVGTRAFVEIETQGANWQRNTTAKPELSIEQLPFINTPSARLEANVNNKSLDTLRDIRLVAVLSDASGNAYAVSGSYIDAIKPTETRKIVFTWPAPFITKPNSIDIYPVVNLFELK